MAQITESLLRSKFGFNDPNVISGILNDPGQVQRYTREAGLDPVFNAEQTAIKQRQESEALSARQKQEDQGFLDALNAKVGGQETLTDASKRISGELELPALRESALGLTQTINSLTGDIRNVEPQELAASKRFGISAPNLERRIAAKRATFRPNLEAAAATSGQVLPALQAKESQLGQELALLVAQQEKDLRPFFEAQLPLLQERSAREQTNYSEDKQRELDLILENIRQRGTATQNELTRANQLAVAEQGYQNSLDAIKLSTDEAIREATALKELKGSDGSGNYLTYLQPANQTSSQNQSFNSPPMSSPVGTVTEYPQGSGIYWTSTGGGWK